MSRARIPQNAAVLFEVGSERPTNVAFRPFSPFKILGIVTNGKKQYQLLWVIIRRTGIYVTHGGPVGIHTSYHMNGTFHCKIAGRKVSNDKRPTLPDILEPILIQSATLVITDEALALFELTWFADDPVDRIVYLDNRMLPDAIHYQVWAVPPFEHGRVPLLTTDPAQLHVTTQTLPWLEIVIYEQGKRALA